MIGLGLVGFYGGRVTERSDYLPARDTRLAIGFTLDGGEAAAFVPPAAIVNSRSGERVYLLDRESLLPRFMPYAYVSDGYRLDSRRVDELYAAIVPDELRSSTALVRYAPTWLAGQRVRPVADDDAAALRFALTSAVPVDDGVEHRSVEEQLRLWLACPDWDRELPSVITVPRAIGAPGGRDNDEYRVRARDAGLVADITPTHLKIRYHTGHKSHVRRPRGLPYAVEQGQRLERGQVLFDFRAVERDSAAHKALKRLWRRRMFVVLGGVEYVRLEFVTKVWPRCPVCFDILEHGECRKCSANAGAAIQGQPAVTDLRTRPLWGSTNYAGDPAALAAIVPPVESLPVVAEYTRRFGRRGCGRAGRAVPRIEAAAVCG